MNKIPCLYAIVRFAPFVETGEFANVGIVLMSPERHVFAFKLMERRHARITHFFEQLDAKIFRATMKNLRDEFDRAATMLKQHGANKDFKSMDVEFAKRLFGEIVRPRETVIKFSEARAILAVDPIATLEELYGHYVERDFVTREYQEAVMERGVRKWLWQARYADRFQRLEVGNDEYHATFPFVEVGHIRPLKVIKPLNLAHDQSSKILDHGGQWLFRIQSLDKRRLLPEKILFAVHGPKEAGARNNAYAEIVENLKYAGAEVLPFEDKELILEFAGR